MSMHSPVVLWNFLDGRRGHENQVRALSNALSELTQTHVQEIRMQPSQYGVRGLLPSRWRSLLNHLPAPNLLIGAGHRTQASLITCRRLYGGRTVTLMKPGLPASWFDFCLIPQHDSVRSSYPGILRTSGPLTIHRRHEHPDSQRWLILLGGPSRHYRWNTTHVIRSLQSLLNPSPDHGKSSPPAELRRTSVRSGLSCRPVFRYWHPTMQLPNKNSASCPHAVGWLSAVTACR